MKVIIAINAGSSSLKISAFSVESRNDTSPKEMASAQISGLSAPPWKLTYSRFAQSVHKDKEMDGEDKSLDDAFNLLIETLIADEELREISSKEDIALACHRVVHGGDYETAQLITKDTYHHIEKLSDLAPLHNSAALGIINSCVKELRTAVNIACFDTQFHTSIPTHISTYPIDQDIAQNNRLRKYGFHGISYAFISRSVAQFLGKPQEKLNIIALHLGSGASACAIKDGKSWDTSMGLTPLAGLPGATRSGSVDPSLVFHYASDVGKLSPASTAQLHISKAEEILNKHCGWSALTGTTDFGKIAASKESQCILAFQLLVDRIAGFIGSYYVSLEGRVDALVFAGGIGEKSASLRAAVSERVSCLGFTVDEAANEKYSKAQGAEVVANITGANKTRSILVCCTDEQFEMARTCTSREELWLDCGS